MKKISEQLIKNFKKYRLNETINLSEIRMAKRLISEINIGLIKINRNEDLDPSHKVYTQIQNVLSFFSEQISGYKAFEAYYDMVAKFDEEFMPSYPPMSPITGSYFSYFCLCDFRFGKHKETMSTIFKDLALKFKYDKLLIKAIDNLIGSSMKFYKHLGIQDDLVELMDINTGAKQLCVNTSKYLGSPGEIWFVRLVPNLDTQFDYQIVLNTPYIIVNQNEKDWVDYFTRQGINKNELGNENKIQNLMKYNIDDTYWHNYIMDGYVNFAPNCIYLTGIPDIKGSKPHETL